MPVATEYVLHKAVLEVRYREGIVYLDHCGSIMVALERLLGEPFKPSVPGMQYGELKSMLERLLVRYGPENFTVDQTWLETPARFQKLAPECWAEVAKSLSLENKVTRCGLRLWAHWAVESLAEAHAAMTGSGLVQATPLWAEMFGAPATNQFVGVSTRGGAAKLRAEIGTIQAKVEGRFPAEEEKFAIPVAVQLDLDSFVEEPKKFGKNELKAFLDSSFVESRKLFDRIGQVLHANSN